MIRISYLQHKAPAFFLYKFLDKTFYYMNWTASLRSQKESDKCCQPKKNGIFACTCAGGFPSELLPTVIQGDNRVCAKGDPFPVLPANQKELHRKARMVHPEQ